MSSDPHWKSDYPISQPAEHAVSRREMAKFACLGVAVCAGAAALRSPLFPPPEAAGPLAVAREDELAIGDSKLFHYPTANHPAILLKLSDGSYAAYSQSCTHLMCPVHFEAGTQQLVCPCHAGFFDARNGRVLSGPPPKPLPSYPVSIKDGTIIVG